MALYIISLLGTGGDVWPGIVIARELQQRGHSVVVLSYDYFKIEITSAGLSFISIGTSESYLAQITQASFWARNSHLKALEENGYLRQAFQPEYEYIASRQSERPNLVCTRNAYGARFAAEKFGLMCLCLAYSPTQLVTAARLPYSLPYLSRLPLWIKNILASLGDHFYNQPLLPKMNILRNEVSLPPIQRMREWNFFSNPSIALFPAWFDDISNVVEASVYQGDFIFYMQDEGALLADDLEDFLQAGSKPIVFTFGTGIAHVESIFRRAVYALKRAGRRGIFITKFEQNLPFQLSSEDVLIIKFANFSALLPRVALIVHHGGIGTAAQAIRAGIPQLIIPQAFDQPDNAYRLKSLGLAEFLGNPKFSAEQLEAKIEKSITGINFEKLQQLQQSLRESVGGEKVAEICEQFFDKVGSSNL
jgi:rhamnosyltransferase subunit B